MTSGVAGSSGFWRNGPSTDMRAGREGDAATAVTAASGEAPAASFRVTLSDDAWDRLYERKQALDRLASAPQQTDKDLARARVEEIKKRIESLKKLVMFMSPSAAKGVMNEIRQLAGQLADAAATLKAGGGGSAQAGGTVIPINVAVSAGGAADAATAGGAATAGNASVDASAEVSASEPAAAAAAPAAAAPVAAASAAAAYAAQHAAGHAGEAGADASAAEEPDAGATDAQADDAAVQAATTQRQDEARQRDDDAKALREAVRALKALLAMVQAKLRDADAQSRRDADDAHALLQQAARATEGGAALSLVTAPTVDVPAAAPSVSAA
ncbi:hypothetical protein [Bordetella genomosp. 1]|nr:hypothetical protein [Bordetella genomosp. 1]